MGITSRKLRERGSQKELRRAALRGAGGGGWLGPVTDADRLSSEMPLAQRGAVGLAPGLLRAAVEVTARRDSVARSVFGDGWG